MKLIAQIHIAGALLTTAWFLIVDSRQKRAGMTV
jgi:hypothetical protein